MSGGFFHIYFKNVLTNAYRKTKHATRHIEVFLMRYVKCWLYFTMNMERVKNEFEFVEYNSKMILEFFLCKLNTYNNDIISYRVWHNIECLIYTESSNIQLIIERTKHCNLHFFFFIFIIIWPHYNYVRDLAAFVSVFQHSRFLILSSKSVTSCCQPSIHLFFWSRSWSTAFWSSLHNCFSFVCRLPSLCVSKPL